MSTAYLPHIMAVNAEPIITAGTIAQESDEVAHEVLLTWKFDGLRNQRTESSVVTCLSMRMWLSATPKKTECSITVQCSDGTQDNFPVVHRRRVAYVTDKGSRVCVTNNASTEPSITFKLQHATRCTEFEVRMRIASKSAWSAKSLPELRSFYRQGRHSDFFMVSGDKVTLRAHRSILAAGSDVFKAMLIHDTQERRSGRVVMADSDGLGLVSMLEWLYTGQIQDLSVDRLRGAYVVADKYLMNAMIMYLSSKFQAMERIPFATLAHHYRFARRYNLDGEVRCARQSVRHDYMKFALAGGMKTISQSGRHVLAEFKASVYEADPQREGTIRWATSDVREIGKDWVRSPPIHVRSLAWSIDIRKTTTKTPPIQDVLGVYLSCNMNGEVGVNLLVNSVYKLIPFSMSVAPIELVSRAWRLTSTKRSSGWGYPSFIPMAKLLDPATYSLQLKIAFAVDDFINA